MDILYRSHTHMWFQTTPIKLWKISYSSTLYILLRSHYNIISDDGDGNMYHYIMLNMYMRNHEGNRSYWPSFPEDLFFF